MEKAIINILGSCISRDLFSRQLNDGNYRISKYSNEFDVFSVNSSPVSIDKDRYYSCDISKNMSNYLKRCLYLDMTKNTLEYIKEEKANYLILDSAMCRFPNICVSGVPIVSTPRRKKVLSFLKENEIICFDKLDEYYISETEMKEKLKEYCDSILEIYSPSEIVLIDIQAAYFHDDGHVLTPFTTDKIGFQNKRMKFGFNCMAEFLKGCHVIPMPDVIVSDTHHWLGLAILHYTQEYYDYAYNCIEIINKKYDIETELNLIRELCTNLTRTYITKYFNSLALQLKSVNSQLVREKNISESRDLQAKFFRELCHTGGDLTGYFLHHKINSVIIYGWTRISEYLVKELSSCGIKIVCIFEDMKCKKIGGHIVEGGIDVVLRSSLIPEADCIFIADLFNKEKIIKSLEKRTKLNIITDETILSYLENEEKI